MTPDSAREKKMKTLHFHGFFKLPDDFVMESFTENPNCGPDAFLLAARYYGQRRSDGKHEDHYPYLAPPGDCSGVREAFIERLPEQNIFLTMALVDENRASWRDAIHKTPSVTRSEIEEYTTTGWATDKLIALLRSKGVEVKE